ncbi:hypothetical protein CH375_15230 [Leptospira ellisii]|uniref:Uncharacterized protein n=1 Tax=Leptospira ellisii TaxID=2023197 RepID=A0A2N0B6E9_9LEPT|nr:hypothetical protein CH379_15105 [Leptospira ellisii]PKA03731.1 hypothetical protein CH375_15230 [Leptospira ellisii]
MESESCPIRTVFRKIYSSKEYNRGPGQKRGNPGRFYANPHYARDSSRFRKNVSRQVRTYLCGRGCRSSF